MRRDRGIGEAAKVTARDIVIEIIRNMREGSEEMYSRVLVPSFYQVFLHEGDFQRLKPITAHLVSDARVALADALRDLNRRRLIDRLASGKPTKYECAGDEWRIEVFQDPDQELAPGTVRVQSQLLLPQRPGIREGAVTRFTITRTDDVRIGVDDAGSSADARVNGAVLAEFKYPTEAGEITVGMTRPEFLIGRGGPDCRVDLELSNQSVSEVHIRIRHNSLTGAFLLENCGRFGTTVDGRGIPKGSEVVLPPKAKLGLANGTSIVEFAAMG
jgi:hypothetical protein